jgi:ankyrin repeat protein
MEPSNSDLELEFEELEFDEEDEEEDEEEINTVKWGEEEPDITNFIDFINKGVNINAKNEKGETMLIHACKKNDYEMVTVLLRLKADVNCPSLEGLLPLVETIKNGTSRSSLEIIKKLLKNGASPSLKDSNGKSLNTFIRNCNNLMFKSKVKELINSF